MRTQHHKASVKAHGRIDDISPEEDAQLQESAMRAAVLRNEPMQSGVAGSGSGSTHRVISSPAIQQPPAPLPVEDLVLSTDEYMNICRSFISQLESGSAPWLLQRLNNTYGRMPTDPSEFSYWMALVSWSGAAQVRMRCLTAGDAH